MCRFSCISPIYVNCKSIGMSVTAKIQKRCFWCYTFLYKMHWFSDIAWHVIFFCFARGRLTSNSVNRGRGNSANYNTRPQRWEKFQANSQQPYSQLSGYEQRIGGSYHPGPCGDTGQQTGPSINYGRQKQQTPRSRGKIVDRKLITVPTFLEACSELWTRS